MTIATARATHVLTLTMTLSFGCSGSDEDAGSSDGGDADTASSESTGAAGVQFDGRLIDYLAASMGATTPVVGATICAREQPDVTCATSDAEGNYTLEGLADGPFVLAIAHADYPPYILHAAPIDADLILVVQMVVPEVITLLVQMAGGDADPARGHITAQVSDAMGALAGVSATLSPMDSEFPTTYLDPSGQVDPTATATSTAGFFGWANIPPGPHSYVLSHPSLTCSSPLDPDGTGTNVVIEANTVTVAVAYTCL